MLKRHRRATAQLEAEWRRSWWPRLRPTLRVCDREYHEGCLVRLRLVNELDLGWEIVACTWLSRTEGRGDVRNDRTLHAAHREWCLQRCRVRIHAAVESFAPMARVVTSRRCESYVAQGCGLCAHDNKICGCGCRQLDVGTRGTHSLSGELFGLHFLLVSCPSSLPVLLSTATRERCGERTIRRQSTTVLVVQ